MPVDLSGVKSENGVIFASGAFALDEYGAEPFDMVGIRLNGVLKEGQRISSAPMFFRVKELREEIGVVDCPGGGYTEKYNFIALSCGSDQAQRTFLRRVQFAQPRPGSRP